MTAGNASQWQENLADMATGIDTLASQMPTNTATQPVNTAGNVVVKASAGKLWSATVTATGTAELDIYDNASTNSGTKLLSIPANAVVGTIYQWTNGQPALNGIVSNGVANCPGVTFAFS